MKSGETYPITVQLSVSAHSFRKGHQIAVLITSSNYPKFEINKNLAKPDGGNAKPVIARNRIHHNREYPSALILPVASVTK